MWPTAPGRERERERERETNNNAMRDFPICLPTYIPTVLHDLAFLLSSEKAQGLYTVCSIKGAIAMV